ncbi:MAG: hypothetical protein ACYCT1_08140 [Steroidobacteraceae bacterium]
MKRPDVPTNLPTVAIAAQAIAARHARQEARAARVRAEEVRAIAEGPEPTYPEAWAAEEAEAVDAVAAAMAEALWEAHRETPSLLSRIRYVTSGRMVRPCRGTEGDWRSYCPSHYLRMRRQDEFRTVAKRGADGSWREEQQVLRAGMPADEVADMLGFSSDDDLLQAIIAEAQDGAGYTHAEALAEGREAAWRDPDVAALRMAHGEAFDAQREAYDAALAQVDMWATYADTMEAAAAQADAALVALGRIPPAVPAPAARPEVPALPSRRARKAAARAARPNLAASLAQAASGIVAAVAGMARRIPQEARGRAVAAVATGERLAVEAMEGAAIVGGWLMEPAAALWTDATREAAALLGIGGRHGRQCQPAPRGSAEVMQAGWWAA